MTTNAVWELLERYGEDGTYARSWASTYGPVSQLVRLMMLEREKAHRDGTVPNGPATDEHRLFSLLFVRWYVALQDDAERQLQVCLVLGIEPPASVDPKGAVKARWNAEQAAVLAMGRERGAQLYPPGQQRPWYWPHEERIGNIYRGEHHDWPVCYPHDWPEPRVDVYGFADRWTPGEVLVIPADALPHEAEVVSPKPAARYEAEPRGELEDGIEVAEVCEEPTASDEVPHPARLKVHTVGRWHLIDAERGVVLWNDGGWPM